MPPRTRRTYPKTCSSPCRSEGDISHPRDPIRAPNDHFTMRAIKRKRSMRLDRAGSLSDVKVFGSGSNMQESTRTRIRSCTTCMLSKDIACCLQQIPSGPVRCCLRYPLSRTATIVLQPHRQNAVWPINRARIITPRPCPPPEIMDKRHRCMEELLRRMRLKSCSKGTRKRISEFTTPIRSTPMSHPYFLRLLGSIVLNRRRIQQHTTEP